MQIVATLGDFRMKSEEDEEKLRRKHSSPSTSESGTMETDTHCEVSVSDISTDPLTVT